MSLNCSFAPCGDSRANTDQGTPLGVSRQASKGLEDENQGNFSYSLRTCGVKWPKPSQKPQVMGAAKSQHRHLRL